MRHKSAACRVHFGCKMREMRNVGPGFGWWSDTERMTDGPKMGRRMMIAKCEKGWKESSRHKMGQRMDLRAKWDEN